MNLASAALSHGQAVGLPALEVHVEQTKTWRVEWQAATGGEPQSKAPASAAHVTLRAHGGDGRTALCETGFTDVADLHRLVDELRDALKQALVTPHEGLAARFERPASGLGIFDRRQASIEDADRQGVVEENVEDAASVPGVKPLGFTYTEVLSDRAVASSAGASVSEASTRYMLHGKVEFGDHAVEQSVQSRIFADAASLPLGADLARQASQYRGGVAVPTGARPVVIDPRVSARLMEAVLPAFDRRRMEAGESFVTMGRRVGSERLHAIDDAQMPGGFRSRAFDVRGVPSLDLPLIREGVVGALYQDTVLARALDGRSSGHEGVAGVWPGNLVLRAGTRSRNMIFSDLGPFLLLDDLIPGAPACDLQTGQLKLRGHFFSGSGSDDLQYVGVHTITTTFVDLWMGIIEVANDQQRHGAIDVSTWIVDGLTVG